MKIKTKAFIAIGITALLTSMSSESFASAFQLFEQNAVNMGDFGAGGAAIAEDASTAYYNPAGMLRICHQQLVVSGDVINTDFEFSGINVWSTPSPLVPPGFRFVQAGNNVQGGNANFVPALHYVAPICDWVVFGVSVVSPFGLQTGYAQTSPIRYSATDTKLITIDISPSLGFKVTNKFSLGAGFDATHLDVTLNSIAGLPIIPSQPTRFDTQSKNDGTAWGYGWHAGALYQFTPATRIGLAYHSQLNFNVHGRSRFVGPLAGLAISGTPTSGTLLSGLQADVTLPPWTELSAYHDINCHWAVDASIIYTQWSIFNKNLILKGVRAVTIDPNTGMFLPVILNPVIPQNFHNTWRFAVGGNYHPIKPLLFRAGVGYDPTPTNNTDRIARLPDGDRYAVALGAHYQISCPIGLDVGWTHLFIRNTNIRAPAITGLQVSTAVGSYKSHADLFGAQLTWNFT